MNKRISMAFALLFSVCTFLLTSQVTHADGIIIIDPPPAPEVPSYLTVKYHRVTVQIKDQVVTTHVDQVFVNESEYQMEGTYVFPLPEGAAIEDFGMWVDGERLSGEILPAEKARRVYEEIVRRQRDPALLEYIGRNTFRARIFPIPPRSEKRVEIEYRQVLSMENGLFAYSYPLDTERFSAKPIQDVSIHVEIRSNQEIKAVYSPSHDVEIDRQGDRTVAVGYEDSDVLPDTDFELYYAVADQDVGLNLLSYVDDQDEGFFLLLLAPRVEVEETNVVARDVILVLDTSGSMRGEKLAQAQDALTFVLDQLHERDRFSVLSFSTGVRRFQDELVDVSARDRAERWVGELEAKGGTNIDRAMVEALAQATPERPTVVFFITDGLATEGEVETSQILHSVDSHALENVRIFTFGVGDDVNTLLLDQMARDHRGASTYVRPGQNITQKVSALYARVSVPLLSDLSLDFGGVQVEDTYPYPLPDLFAGTQIVMAGRYLRGGVTTVTLRGTIQGREQTFEFGDVHFREQGGDAFIPRLWATRKVGYLLNQIRLYGESKEIVDEIVDLSVRYGIMTPYTAFLVDEDNEVFSGAGRREMAEREYSAIKRATPAAPSGKAAVDESQQKTALERSDTATGATGTGVKVVGDKVFLYREGMWIDTIYDADRMTPLKIGFMSDEYLDLLDLYPEWGPYLAVGDRLLVILGGQAYQVVARDEGQKIDIPVQKTPQVDATLQASPTIRVSPTRTPGGTVEPVANVSSPARSTVCGGAAIFLLIGVLASAMFMRLE